MSYEISFIGKGDLIKAIPMGKERGFAIGFIQEFDMKNKRKKKRGYLISEDMLVGLENYVKLQREFFDRKKELGK